MAIDMWSIGCITALLLTGSSPFVDPITNQHSRNMAQKCNMEHFENMPEWKSVGRRPIDFVKRLLVLDEGKRMTAKEALNHPWFSNDFHEIDFEAVYERAIKGWKKRTVQLPMVDIRQLENPERIATLLKPLPPTPRESWRGNPMPVDPPYRTYSKRIDLAVCPKQSRGSPYPSLEVDQAMKELWPSKGKGLPGPSDADSRFGAASPWRTSDSSRRSSRTFMRLPELPSRESKVLVDSPTRRSLLDTLRKKLFSPKCLTISKSLKSSIVRRYFETDKSDMKALRNLDLELKQYETDNNENTTPQSHQRRRLMGLAKNPLMKPVATDGSGAEGVMGPPPLIGKRSRSIFDVDEEEVEDGIDPTYQRIRKRLAESRYGGLRSPGKPENDGEAGEGAKKSSSPSKLPSLSKWARGLHFRSGDGFDSAK